jgi:hypothetical protein
MAIEGGGIGREPVAFGAPGLRVLPNPASIGRTAGDARPPAERRPKGTLILGRLKPRGNHPPSGGSCRFRMTPCTSGRQEAFLAANEFYLKPE